MRVCMFVKNSFEFDARVTKEARSLAEHGHHVTVVALLVPGVTPPRETTTSGVDVVRVPQLDFGLSWLGGVLADRAERREIRRAAAEGRAPDVAGVRHRSSVALTSTATPGAAAREPDRRAGGRADAHAARKANPVARAIAVAKPVLGPPARLLRHGFANMQMTRAASAVDADVHHAHDLNTLWVASRTARARRAKVVYDAHEMHACRTGVGAVRRRYAAWLERRLIRRVDAAITVSASIARHMAAIPGAPEVTVVRNVPDRVQVDAALDLRAELGIAAADRIILYQGTVQPHRGIEELIDAIQLVDRCVLVVIGHGDHRPTLEASVARRSLSERVHFFGPVDNRELIRWSASADVGTACIKAASLSYFYSLPNKLFEYMMAGLPVVASDFPEMADVVRSHDVGRVCDPSQPASIAHALREVLDDSAEAARLRANALRAAERCNWGFEQDVLLDVYRRLGLSGGGEGRAA